MKLSLFFASILILLTMTFSCEMINEYTMFKEILDTNWDISVKPEGEPHNILIFNEDKTYEILNEDLYVIERGVLSNITDSSFEYRINVQTEIPTAIGNKNYSEFSIEDNTLEITFYDSPEKQIEYISFSAAQLYESVNSYSLIAETYSDFNDTQGEGNTYFGYYNTPFNQASFNEFPSYDSSQTKWYISDNYWTSIGVDSFHPNGPITSGDKESDEHWPVRRWVSSVSGTIKISGKLAKINSVEYTDGVKGAIVIEGNEVWSSFIDGTDTEGETFTIDVEVEENDKIDFLIAPRDTDYADDSNFIYRIDME